MTTTEITKLLKFYKGDVEKVSAILQGVDIGSPLAAPQNRNLNAVSGSLEEASSEDLEILAILMDLEESSDTKAEAKSLKRLVIHQSFLEHLEFTHELKPGTLPAQIKYFSNLTSLYCGHIKLTSLPAEIGELSQLRDLNCSHNHLRSLPPDIGRLTQLNTLVCMYNQLIALPKEIGELNQLETLKCNNNLLTSLPLEIRNLSQLSHLSCRFNFFYRLPLSLGSFFKPNYGFVLMAKDNINSEQDMIDYIEKNVERGRYNARVMTKLRENFYSESVKDRLRDVYDREEKLFKRRVKSFVFTNEPTQKGDAFHLVPSGPMRDIVQILQDDFNSKYVVLRKAPGSTTGYKVVLEQLSSD